MSPLNQCLRCSVLGLNNTPNQDALEAMGNAPFGPEAIVAELRRIAAILESRLPERSSQGQRFVDLDEREQLVADFLQKHAEATASDIEQALRNAGYKISTTSVKRTKAWQWHRAKKNARDVEL